MDTNDEWIQSRVGIAERRWASEDETLVEMAVAAGGKALAASGLAPDDIDLVIVASASLRAPIPGIGPQVAHQLGIPRPGAFDLNAGCAGFCYALGVANDASAPARRATPWSSAVERLTDVTDLDRPVDRGDLRRRRRRGRGRRPSDEPGIGPVVWGSDGDQYNAIEIAAGSSTMTMAGQAVYRWATTKLTETLVEAMARAGVGPDDIDVFARTRPTCGSSSRWPSGSAARAHRHRPRHRQSGNTSAASVPLALSALMESGEAKSGDLALLLGYGAGLTFAGQVVVLP